MGRAVRDSGVLREEIFVTSKLWLQDYGYEQAKKGIARSLRKLDLGYIDLYLIHQPYGDVPGAWKAMEEAKAEGKLRSIGVSNMTPKIWNQFVPQFATKPAVNQVEFNPFFQQKAIRTRREWRKICSPLIKSKIDLASGFNLFDLFNAPRFPRPAAGISDTAEDLQRPEM